MENQQKVILMGHLHGVFVVIEGGSVLTDFEVIETVNDNNPYPSLFGIDWAFTMNVILI